jgi:outer membrane receptor protein involved in Fe transport
LNVPVFSDQNAIPFFQRLDFEASWRHDQYSDFGGTSNQKIGFNWSPIDDLTIRGGWGTSFRAPNFGENSQPRQRRMERLWDCPRLSFPTTTASTSPACNGQPHPVPARQKLKAAVCLRFDSLPGMSFNGGAKGPNVSGWRQFANTMGSSLNPEQSLNWAAGFDYSPTTFLKGLDIQATWYSIKITSVWSVSGNRRREGSPTPPWDSSISCRAISGPRNSQPALCRPGCDAMVCARPSRTW